MYKTGQDDVQYCYILIIILCDIDLQVENHSVHIITYLQYCAIHI
jgi:hypothetical protein